MDSLCIFTLTIMFCLYETTDINGISGSTIQLICQHRGNVVWKKSGIQYSDKTYINSNLPLDLRQRLSITGNYDAGEYHLKIAAIRQSDGGTYECIVTDTSNSGQQTLNVIDPPLNVTIQNTAQDNKLIGTEDEDLIIKCVAVGGNPVPDVSLQLPAISVPSGKQLVQYTLKKVDRSRDRQMVTCTANNNLITTAQTDNAIIYLNLKPQLPLFSMVPVRTEETRPLSVSCTSSGSRPAATFVWLLGLNNIDVTQNSTLHHPVYENITDTYTVTSTLTYSADRTFNGYGIVCGVRNKATTAAITTTTALIVKYAPVVKVQNKTFLKTDAVRKVDCDLIGDPATYTFDKWQHRSFHGELIRELTGNTTLLLPTMPEDRRYQDSGIYTCTATNGIMDKSGKVKQSGSGFITVPPVFPKYVEDNDIQIGEFGEKQILFVNVYSIPKFTTIQWFRGNAELTNGKYVTTDESTTIRDTFHGVDVQLDVYRVTLTIKELEEEDFGNYTLRLHTGIEYVEHKLVLKSRTLYKQEESKSAIWGAIGGSLTVTAILFIVLTGLVVVRRKKGICNENIGEVTSETKTYDTLGPKDKEKIYDGLKKEDISGEKNEEFELQDNVGNQYDNEKQEQKDKNYENERI